MEPLNFTPLSQWGFNFPRPLIISGPCGVESEKQIHDIAAELSKLNVHILRGGIWKPRTRPGSFQGIGTEGLKWLKDAGQANNLPVMVEVANPKHVEEALAEKIDILWLGARTTVNPFQVQEIADSLAGVNIPVMIKNPINPELELWIGAIERIQKTGIHRIAAIHRGFSTFEKTKYRNVPNWQIPIELKRRYPDLPLICDPSHICGTRNLIGSVAQTALDLNYDGLMIESHTHPEKALSDSQQQLTPAALKDLLAQLVVRSAIVEDVIFLNLLEELRDKIDRLDEEILNKISQRMEIAREIGKYKKENNITILQVERWNEILRTRLQFGMDHELTREFILKMYELVHDESILQQTQRMNGEMWNVGADRNQQPESRAKNQENENRRRILE
ncbi:bifunctional 3-deoxy-7-phosphoheptulonate synthase/chorismate mutase type II [soil metagenome]